MNKRGLTPGEIELAKSIYGDSIDYSKVRVNRGGAVPNSGWVPRNTMFLGRGFYQPDFSIANVPSQGLFVHEMSHVRDYQLTGKNNILSREAARDYNYLEKIAAGNFDINTYTIEERAQAYQDLHLSRVNVFSNSAKSSLLGKRVGYSIPSIELLERISGVQRNRASVPIPIPRPARESFPTPTRTSIPTPQPAPTRPQLDGSGPLPTSGGRPLSGPIINTHELREPDWNSGRFRDAFPSEDLGTFSKPLPGAKPPPDQESNFEFSVVPQADPINYVPGETFHSPVHGLGMPGVFDPATQPSVMVEPVTHEVADTALSTFNGALGAPSKAWSVTAAAPADNVAGPFAGTRDQPLGMEAPGILAATVDAVGPLNHARSDMAEIPGSVPSTRPASYVGSPKPADTLLGVANRSILDPDSLSIPSSAPLAGSPAVQALTTAAVQPATSSTRGFARQSRPFAAQPNLALAVTPPAAVDQVQTARNTLVGVLGSVIGGLAETAREGGGLLSGPFSGMQAPGQWMGGILRRMMLSQQIPARQWTRIPVGRVSPIPIQA